MRRIDLPESARALREGLLGKNCVCAVCGADVFEREEHFCARCRAAFPYNAGFVCSKCGRAVGDDYPVCTECKTDLPAYERAKSAYRYEGEAVRLIRAFKTGARYLAEALAADMAPLLAAFPDAQLLLPVPMTKRAVRRRGYNQAVLLARELGGRSGLPVAETMLLKTRETGVQKTLSRRERAENLQGSFRVRERALCRGKAIVVVDDVMTTGATANACARALYGAGAGKVYLLTAASVPLRLPGDGQNAEKR